ncbi:MAG: glycine cleavage system protein GcvH [Phycisphaeraceae bacterium]|nr:glycine cleavage system protein GcvH [Phycisphaeraceae bacterium]
MASPDDRKYQSSHEWHKPEDDGTVTIGISAFAVEELTDITFVEIEVEPGDELDAGEVFGEIESVKATSELYCGISGEVVAVNDQLDDTPETVNDDPWDAGWMIRVKPADEGALDGLMDASAYDEQAT